MPRQRKSIQQRFCEFHQRHPDVYWLFRAYALEAKAAGFRRFSARAIMERIRWHHSIERGQGERFKINDHYGGRNARWRVPSRTCSP